MNEKQFSVNTSSARRSSVSELGRLCSEDSDFSLKSEEMCHFFDKRGYLLLLFKQAIIAPNKLIGSQHYKRLRRRIIIEFHRPLQKREGKWNSIITLLLRRLQC